VTSGSPQELYYGVKTLKALGFTPPGACHRATSLLLSSPNDLPTVAYTAATIKELDCSVDLRDKEETISATLKDNVEVSSISSNDESGGNEKYGAIVTVLAIIFIGIALVVVVVVVVVAYLLLLLLLLMMVTMMMLWWIWGPDGIDQVHA